MDQQSSNQSSNQSSKSSNQINSLTGRKTPSTIKCEQDSSVNQDSSTNQDSNVNQDSSVNLDLSLSLSISLNQDSSLNQSKQQLTCISTSSGSFPNRFCWFSGIVQCLSPIVDCLKEFSNKNQKSIVKHNWVVSYNSLVDLEYITSGAEGLVFKAQLNGETIAVKKVKNKEETEIQHLKTMKHHNIIRFLGITTTPYPCILMEYCPNGTLANLLKQQKFTIQSDLIWEFAFQIGKFQLD